MHEPIFWEISQGQNGWGDLIGGSTRALTTGPLGHREGKAHACHLGRFPGLRSTGCVLTNAVVETVLGTLSTTMLRAHHKRRS